MFAVALRRSLVLPLVAALVLLASAGCSDGPGGTSASGLRAGSVDSSDTRAHRLTSLIERADTLSTLMQALRQAKLARDLRRNGPYTLFAPTDRAFQRRWPGFDSLLASAGTTSVAQAARRRASFPEEEAAAAPRDRDSLRSVLRFHLVRGRFTAADFTDSLRLGTLTGEPLRLERGQRHRLRLRVEDMPRPIPIRRTVEAQNGVIHVVSRPLRPPGRDTTAQGALGDTTAAAAANAEGDN